MAAPAIDNAEHDADLARSIASQASVALENHRLYQEIRDLFDGFVTAAEGRAGRQAMREHRRERMAERRAARQASPPASASE